MCDGVLVFGFDTLSCVSAHTYAGLMENIIACFLRVCPCCKPKEEVPLPLLPVPPSSLSVHVADSFRVHALNR
jgi:hypothetical protein